MLPSCNHEFSNFTEIIFIYSYYYIHVLYFIFLSKNNVPPENYFLSKPTQSKNVLVLTVSDLIEL